MVNILAGRYPGGGGSIMCVPFPKTQNLVNKLLTIKVVLDWKEISQKSLPEITITLKSQKLAVFNQ